MTELSFALFLLMASPAVGSETAATQIELTQGLPDFPPLARKYETGWHARVSPQDTFVWIERTDEREEAFWLLNRHENGSSLAQLSLEPAGEVAEGRHSVGVDSGIERVLHLQLDRENRILMYRWSGEKSSVVSRGEPIPDQTLRAVDGASFNVSEFRGKWVVLNWWATYCVPCKEEIPSLNQLAESRAADDIVFLAVALDEPETLRRFLLKHPFDYRQSFGDEKLMTTFGNQFPRHLIISPDGTIMSDIVGGSPDIATRLGEEIDRVRGTAGDVQ